MTAEDYTIVQGLPGTGKSQLITFAARLLAAHGKRVLITAYTHSAVDNVLVKLMDKGLSTTSEGRPTPAVLRVGNTASCHPRVKQIIASEAALKLESQQHRTSNQPSVESLKTTLNSACIIGATALTVPRTPLLYDRLFDVVIVDEAGQINQPAVLGPLMAARHFVLVGDHMQLPPLVASELAAKGGTWSKNHHFCFCLCLLSLSNFLVLQVTESL